MFETVSSCLDENRLLDFLAGDGREDSDVLVHIGDCDACRDWLATMATLYAPGVAGHTPPSDMATEVSAFESRFRFGRVIGQGGMGLVWEATDLSTGTQVAIKVVPASDGVLRRRTLREARMRERVSHPHLLMAHEQFETLRGDIALVMVRLHGEDLGDRLVRQGPLQWEAARTLLAPIASALSAMHAAGLVHRDVKPQNIFIGGSGTGGERQPWLLDFGMAKVMKGLSVSSAGGTLTAEKSVLGTPHYMAPEQLYGEPDVAPPADVWAFGVVLFEVLSGERSAPGKSFGQVFRAVTTGGLRQLKEVAPHLPEVVTTFVHGLLVQDPAARPTMTDVETALKTL